MTAPTALRRVSPAGLQVLSADASRELWLAERRNYLCSSDMAAVLGVTQYSTALHVYLEKKGEAPPDEAGEPALWGTVLEDAVAREWTRRNRSVTRRVGLIRNAERTWQACTLDRVVVECPDGNGPCALEIKCRSAFKAGQWKREVPDDVMAQVYWAMTTAGYQHMHVAVLIGGNDYRQFTVKLDKTLAADIVTAGEKFWTEHVLAGSEPEPPATGYGEVLGELYDALNPDREGNQHLTDLDDQMEAEEALRAYELARIQESRSAQAKKDARAKLLKVLGPCDTAIIEDRLAFTYTAHDKAGFDMNRLKAEFPEAYAACCTTTEVRTLRIAKSYKINNDTTEV